MKNKERERQSKVKHSTSGTTKTPLTFYRSAESKADAKSPFNKKEVNPTVGKIRSFFAAFLDGVIIISLLILLAYSLIIRPKSHVQLNSQIFHPASTYQEAANKILSGIKNINKITFSENEVILKLQQQFPEITSGTVELPILAQTPVVHLKIANPSFTINSGGKTYIVDSDGVAVADAAKFPNAQKLLKVDDQSGFSTGLGKQVMSADSVRFINSVAKQCGHANVTISSLTLPSLAEELDLRTNDKPYYVKFYLGGDVLQQTGQFLASRHQFDSTNTQPAEYLDVRIPGKIFYK
jgi:hypothetical protein